MDRPATDPYLDRFSGIARLYGNQVLENLRRAHVLIVGVGGVGCWAAEALARSGIGTLTLVDPDDLCVTNTNRQIHALHPHYGRSKAAVLAERLHHIQPEMQVVIRQEFLSDRNLETLLSPAPDAVLDAIDAVKAKCVLIDHCRKNAIPLITSGGAGGRIDPLLIRVDDLARTTHDALLLAVRKRLRKEYGFPSSGSKTKPKRFGIEAIYSTESPRYPTCDGEISADRPKDLHGGLKCDSGYGTSTPMVATFGMIAAARCIERLRSQESPGA